MIKEAIAILADGGELNDEQTTEVAHEIMDGQALPTQIAAFITALRCRGERVEDVVSFVRVMREKATPLNVPDGPILDTCGTGGDGSNTFNISTAAAIVAAAAGITVAKHGNRAVSSSCGSADVLTELGVKVDVPVEGTERCLAEIGLGFMFAPLYHGAMKHAIGPRREVGIRTIFNLLGPLSNPAKADHQLLGVYHVELTQMFAEVLAELGTKRAMIVH
ncbi:anthranilate phosphoribosyltransferase, partial [Candidatus Sumerlaeota bacterium]